MSSPAQGVKELEERLGLTLRGFVEGTTTVPTHLALPLDSLAAFLRSHLHLQAQGERPRSKHIIIIRNFSIGRFRWGC